MTIDYVLLFFGATLFYTAFLVSSQNAAVALIIAVLGAALIIKPLLHLYLYFKPSATSGGSRHGRGKAGRGQGKKNRHLKIVEPEEKKPPTYH
jgi:hypothetical protein